MYLSIVIPVFNEEEVLPTFHASLLQVLTDLPHSFEVIYVAGGSTDRTSEIIRAWHEADKRIKLLELSRNYGHQAALTAGIDFAKGDVVITMDGDGQHPPSVLPQLIAEYERGSDVVLTRRVSTEKIGFVARLLSHSFYRVINWLGETQVIPNSSDFRLLSREVVDDLRTMREQHRFLRGMIIWVGYQQSIVDFEAPARSAGRSKFTLKKRLRLASDAIFSFSTAPIVLVIVMGVLLLLFAILYLVYVMAVILTTGLENMPRGWASLMMAILGIGGIQLLTSGLIGYYVGMTFQESKSRPIYFVNRRLSRLADDELSVPLEKCKTSSA